MKPAQGFSSFYVGAKRIVMDSHGFTARFFICGVFFLSGGRQKNSNKYISGNTYIHKYIRTDFIVVFICSVLKPEKNTVHY